MLFAEDVVLNTPEAKHAAAVLLGHLRTLKGDTQLDGGHNNTDHADN